MSVAKYSCSTCGSSISNNTTSINIHVKTKKHLRGFDNNTSVKITNDARTVKTQKMREYRAKKKAELGEEEYKNEMKKEKQKYRVGLNKTNSSVDVNELKSDLQEMKNAKELVLKKEKKTKKVLDNIELKATDNKNDVIDKMVKAGKIKASTAKLNLERIANIYKYITGKQWDFVSIGWLQDVDKVVDAINKKYKDIKQKTRSNQYASIAGFLKYFPDNSELYKKYSKFAVDIVEKLDKKSKDNTLSEKQSKRLNWKEVKKVWKNLGDENGGNSFLRALYGIYTFIPPRRVMDYNVMRVIRKDKMNNKKIEKLDRKYNYLFVDKHRRPIYFTIYNYKSGALKKWGKSNKNDGEYTLNHIPEKLATVLQDYIIDEDIVNGDYLFGLDSNHQKQYSSNAFSSLVSKNLFETFSKSHIGVNDLRSAYVSWFLDEARTLNEKEQMAFDIGSSVGEMLKTYYKVELTKQGI